MDRPKKDEPRSVPVKWEFRFESGAFVIACTIGHLEQGITCVGRTRVAT